MAVTRFKSHHFVIRFVAALVLVFATYNPIDGWSYYDWALEPVLGFSEGTPFSAFKALLGLILIIGWAIFIRATHRSLGPLGLVLAVAFFVVLFWLLIDQGWISLDNTNVLTWLILIALAGVMAVGMSWSHIRRRMSGQLDVDETDDNA